MADISWILMMTLFFGAYVCDDLPCALRQTQFGGVCVCNSSYCDTIERPAPLSSGLYYHYTTSSDNPGFHRTTGSFNEGLKESASSNNSVIFTVNSTIQYQEILGFGGSFTDSAGMAITSLPTKAQAKLIQSYFGIHGIEYSMGRVPVGMSDFSTRIYSYDEVPDDVKMTNFTLVDEDYKYKIPLIHKAMSICPHKIKFIGCAFTSPAWMKTTNDVGAGYIKEAHLSSWAKYHVKFLDAYANHSIPFWALTGGNEVVVFLLFPKLLTIGLIAMPHDHRRWLRDHLAPQLDASSHSNVKFLIMDDMRPWAHYWLSRFASDPVAYNRIEGVALHWYFDWFTNISLADKMHHDFPDKVLLYTESSANTVLFGGQAVELGGWNHAAFYIYNIIENVNHWTSGYLDWNLALNTDGGPYLTMPLDAPIIVNQTGKEFYKNPMFYALGHFSKFIPPGSRRVDVKSNQQRPPETVQKNFNKEIFARLLKTFVKDGPLKKDDPTTTVAPEISTFVPLPVPVVLPKIVTSLATVHPDGSSTVVVFNAMEYDVNVTIVDTVSGYITATVTANSINTFVYWPYI